MDSTSAAIETLACVVEGTTYEVGSDKPIRNLSGIGFVHNAAVPHTILGDPVDPKSLEVVITIDRNKEASGGR